MCRSDPQMLVVVIRTMASPGASIFGTGTSSTATRYGPAYLTAFMTPPRSGTFRVHGPLPGEPAANHPPRRDGLASGRALAGVGDGCRARAGEGEEGHGLAEGCPDGAARQAGLVGPVSRQFPCLRAGRKPGKRRFADRLPGPAGDAPAACVGCDGLIQPGSAADPVADKPQPGHIRPLAQRPFFALVDAGH